MKNWSILIAALLLGSGCDIIHSTREFVARPQPAMTFENWRINIDIWANLWTNGTYLKSNHMYSVRCTAWTARGDGHWGYPTTFRPSGYDANIESFRLVYTTDSGVVELPLNDLRLNKTLDERSFGLRSATLVPIPAEVKELQAALRMNFRNRETGKVETRAGDIRMVRKNTRFGPDPWLIH